jgi:DNA invertase Pin-like site-specific DNA recombinase
MGASASPLRAGVYGRESKGKQKSVDDQVELGAQVIAEHGWVFTGSYDDGSSASRFATKVRADWTRLAGDLASGVLDVLIVWEVTRGTRETVDGFTWLNLCRDNGVLIYVINEEELFDPGKTSHYDRLGRMILDGATESNKTSDRVRRGTRQAAARKEGATPHGRTPYGFLRQLRNPEVVTRPDEMPWDEFYIQVADPVKGPIAAEVIRRIARSTPISELVKDLNFRGLKAPDGGLWTRQAIRQLVRNPAYMGKRKFKKELFDGVWDGLVTEYEWYAANRVLDEPGRMTTKPGLKKWLASYLMVSKCGAPMQAVPPRKTFKAKYRCTKDGCVSIGKWEVDEYLTRLVVARFMRPDARDLFVADGTERAQAEEQLATLEQRLDGFRKSATAGETSPASLAVIERELVPQIEDARRRRDKAGVPAVLVELVTASDVRAAFEALPVAGEREILSTLFNEIKVGPPGKIRLHRTSSDDDKLASAHERLTIR